MLYTYLAIKLLHVLLAILGVGFTSTFGLIMAGAAGKLDALPFALRTLERLEKISAPCFGGLLVTGVLLAWIGHFKWTELWVIGSLTIMGVALVLAMTVASPTLAKQVQLIEQSPLPLDQLQQLADRSRKVGMVLGLMSLTLVSLMIFKPTW